MLYRYLVRPWLFWLSRKDPEIAHEWVMRRLIWLNQQPALMRHLESWNKVGDGQLGKTVFGMHFPNPLGLAAGFDKNAVAGPALAALGFGFLEVGTVTRHQQFGNPRPRIFRLPKDQALINRMGFNNDGIDEMARRLSSLMMRVKIPIGVSLGKSKITPVDSAFEEYLYLLERLYWFGQYFVVNVSSPNTPGLRSLQDKNPLSLLLHLLLKKRDELSKDKGFRPKSILVKVAPDLEWPALDELLEVCSCLKVDGLIAVNTTVQRAGLRTSIDEAGGLSGRPLFQRAAAVVRWIKKRLPQTPVIGVGGISTPDEARYMLDQGADLIQIFTSLIYQGPLLVRKINKALARTAR